MDKLGSDLLDFLHNDEIKKYRNGLYNLLKTDSNEINVYYIVRLQTLQHIVEEQGIRSRNSLDCEFDDISASQIQKQRGSKITIAKYDDKYDRIEKDIHDCVNFFWNPLNNTLSAFQRNSLQFYNEKDLTYGICCIIEVNLQELFNSNKAYWGTSRKNLAVDPFTAHSKKIYGNYSFDWEGIFSLSGDTRFYNAIRSAEFITFYGDSGNNTSQSIPTKFIKRILVPEKYIENITSYIPTINHLVIPLSDSSIFKPRKDLLKSEKMLVKSLNIIHKLKLSNPLSIDIFCQLIDSFSKLGEELNCTLNEDYFFNKNMAYGRHGIRHVTRVMFWAYILCYLSGVDEQTKKGILYSAFIHDLCRQDNSVEEEHGEMAAELYADFLEEKDLPSDILDACKNAVIFHSKDDGVCHQKDILWKILKDADSLERGRFGPPTGYRSKEKASKGCDINYLRLEIFKNNQRFAFELAWLAYRLAVITGFADWSDNTFKDIKNHILNSLRVSLKNNILDYKEKQVANEILAYFETNTKQSFFTNEEMLVRIERAYSDGKLTKKLYVRNKRKFEK